MIHVWAARKRTCSLWLLVCWLQCVLATQTGPVSTAYVEIPSSDSEKKTKDKGEGMEVWAVPLHWGLAQAVLSTEKHAGKTPAIETLAYKMMGRSHSHSRKA